jgi:glutathione S-transferase
MLKLHYYPSSTTSRPVMLFAVEAGISLTPVEVDLFGGEHKSEAFTRLNPNHAVPVLDHDGFVLTECSTILKYLADLTGSPAYPKDLKARARVNELMDWFNTGLMRDYCYGLVYSRILPEYAMPEPGQSQKIAMHQEKVDHRLGVLNLWLGSKPFLTGPEITIADYLGAGFISAGELVGIELIDWPNVKRWMATMKARPAWDEVHAAFYGWKSAIETQSKLSA